MLLQSLLLIVFHLFLFEDLFEYSVAGNFVKAQNLVRYNPFDAFGGEVVKYLPVRLSVQMIVFEALDWVLRHIGPFSLQ